MKRIKILLPWNLQSYRAAGGCHPLYRYIVNNIDMKSFEISFIHYNETDKNRKQEAVNFEFFRNSYMNKKFFDFYNRFDLNLIAATRADIEFHHTVPLWSKTKPFIFHCEAFLPIFMPFAFQGRGFNFDISVLREEYKEIFESDMCLGIFSHIGETIEQFKNFFQSEKINSKLYYLKNAIDKKALNGRKIKNIFPNKKIFLFTSSANQAEQNFVLRGGISVLKNALKLSYRDDVIFLIRSKIPSEEILKKYAIKVDDIIDCKNIIWFDNFLDQQEQNFLFRIADYYLLPSANLHSVSIMEAILNDARPIVNNVYGVSEYVQDQRFIISDLRNIIEYTDSDGILIDSHEKYFDVIDDITMKLDEFLQRALLSTQNDIPNISYKNDEYIADIQKFEKIIIDSYNKSNSNPHTSIEFSTCNDLSKGNHGVNFDNFFEGPINPHLVFNDGHRMVFRFQDHYVNNIGQRIHLDLPFYKPNFDSFLNTSKNVSPNSMSTFVDIKNISFLKFLRIKSRSFRRKLSFGRSYEKKRGDNLSQMIAHTTFYYFFKIKLSKLFNSKLF